MENPLVSVVIPTYNGTKYLGEAVKSILNQTYHNLEVLVVDDCSPEDPLPLLLELSDERIKYLRHERNQGAVSARLSGVRAASGDILAFLDQDDLFHKEKLQAHVSYLDQNPQIGLSYNSRFEIRDSTSVISGLYTPPSSLTLMDFILGFPIAPSDVVLRREWAVREEIWDDSFSSQAEHVIFNGQEIIFGGRLSIAGCKFGMVKRALNYRRFHTRRIQKHLVARCNSELACQRLILEDPRCPFDIRYYQSQAFANIYLMWALVAYLQDDYALGQNFLLSAVDCMPSLLEGNPSRLLILLTTWIVNNIHENNRIEETLNTIFSNLPLPLAKFKEELPWVISKGLLWKGVHELIWGNSNTACELIEKGLQENGVIDTWFAEMYAGDLLNYAAEFGDRPADQIVNRLSNILMESGNSRSSSILQGYYWVNKAFRSYREKDFSQTPKNVIRGVFHKPDFVFNRGIQSILLRSMTNNFRYQRNGK